MSYHPKNLSQINMFMFRGVETKMKSTYINLEAQDKNGDINLRLTEIMVNDINS